MRALQRLLGPDVLLRLSAVTLSARTVASGTTTGRHRAPVRGSSIEFRQHRFYTPGDDPRRLDWRLLARTDRPYVREYEQETNLHGLVLLDRSGSMGFGRGGLEKLLYARRVAAALGYVMLSQGESAGLADFDESGAVRWLPPLPGTTQLARWMERLDRMTASTGDAFRGSARPRFADVCAFLAGNLRRRSLVVVISDLLLDDAELARGLVRLRHARHEVSLYRVLHPAERRFPFQRWTRFVGLEGEGVRVVEPAVVRRLYLRRFDEHRQQLVRACRSLGVVLHESTTDIDLATDVTRFILQRGLTRPPMMKDASGRSGSFTVWPRR
ncbi:MAG: DUF58 domain-containing protein [Tepidisphaerales bacterium]